MDDLDFLIPIAFFFSIVYAIKVVVEARTRAKIVGANVSQELLLSMVQAEGQQRRHSSLRWGIILSALAVGFGMIQALDVREATPAVIALIIGATGVGNLVFYAFTR